MLFTIWSILSSDASGVNVSPATSTLYDAIGRPPSSSGGSQVTLRAKEVKPVSVTVCGAEGAVWRWNKWYSVEVVANEMAEGQQGF